MSKLYEIQYTRQTEDEETVHIRKAIITAAQLKRIKLMPWIVILSSKQIKHGHPVYILD